MTGWILPAVLWMVLCFIPGCLWVLFVWRSPPRRASWFALWGTFALGAIAGLAVAYVQDLFEQAANLKPVVQTFGSPLALAYSFAFAGPLGEGAKLATAWPVFKSRHFDEEYGGFLYSVASATGFASGQSVLFYLTIPLSVTVVVRMEMLAIAHTLVSPLWGYQLGKTRKSRIVGGKFLLAWIAASGVHAVLLHIVSVSSMLALIASVPIFFALAFSTWWASRDLLTHFGRLSRLSVYTVFPSFPTPSVQTIRQAIRQTEGTSLLRWVFMGAASTVGLILTMIALAVWTGHQAGLDFSVIGMDDTSSQTIVPLGLITSSVLAAFPISGFLIAKASKSQGVLEPALASVLAIVLILVLLGLASPVAMVFALAFAPIAFGFACVGAWFGLGK